MKNIKIKPLRSFEDLNLQIAKTKQYNFGDKMTEDLMQKLMEEATKITGAIIAQSPIQGQSAVSASFKPKGAVPLLTLPEPNPVLIYLKISIENFHLSVESKTTFLQTNTLERQTRYLKFIDFFEKATIALTFLVATLEAFINQKIPDDFIIELDGKELDKSALEWKDFKTKIKHIIPAINGITYHTIQSVHYSNILELFRLRNNLIHLKTNNLANKTAYESLLKDVFDADIEKFILAVIHFLNTITPNIIEEQE